MHLILFSSRDGALLSDRRSSSRCIVFSTSRLFSSSHLRRLLFMSYLRHLLFSSAPQRLFSPPVSLLLSLPPVLFHPRRLASSRATALISSALSGASSSVLLRRILARRRSSGLLSFSGFSLISHQRLFSSARRRSSLQRGGALWGRSIVRPHAHARDGAHLRATALILARRRSSHQRTALQRDDAHLRSSSRHLSFLPPPPSLLVLSSVL